jgi:hypothetical protein
MTASNVNSRLFASETRHETSADLAAVCLWTTLGLVLTGFMFEMGFGADIAQILVVLG